MIPHSLYITDYAVCWCSALKNLASLSVKYVSIIVTRPLGLHRHRSRCFYTDERVRIISHCRQAITIWKAHHLGMGGGRFVFVPVSEWRTVTWRSVQRWCWEVLGAIEIREGKKHVHTFQNTFCKKIITFGETWSLHYDPETTRRSLRWRSPGSARQKTCCGFLKSKVCFVDVKGVVHAVCVKAARATGNTECFSDSCLTQTQVQVPKHRRYSRIATFRVRETEHGVDRTWFVPVLKTLAPVTSLLKRAFRKWFPENVSRRGRGVGMCVLWREK